MKKYQKVKTMEKKAKMKIAVIGSGGREHAIAWALAKSSQIKEIFCIPGNGGTAPVVSRTH
mgnify:CR=1 FL=1